MARRTPKTNSRGYRYIRGTRQPVVWQGSVRKSINIARGYCIERGRRIFGGGGRQIQTTIIRPSHAGCRYAIRHQHAIAHVLRNEASEAVTATHFWYAEMTSRRSSGSMRAESAVEPTKSENITVT